MSGILQYFVCVPLCFKFFIIIIILRSKKSWESNDCQMPLR